ncbi:MAG: polysaccharide pyruvyl transferase family protein [Marinomonas sp.]
MSHLANTFTNDLIICSFHTDDEYYTAAGNRLRKSLDALDLPHEITSISADGADWIDICRKKIPFLHSICMKYPDKKVFWIDGDCELDNLPEFIHQSSADIIGFQRGFSSPLKIGYANRTRFWEPCFWGIGTSATARAYIDTALKAEQRLTVRATDDYFFEEAWRIHAEELTFQVIPSGFVAGKSDKISPFFIFGSSGNVAEFKGKAQQHESVVPLAARSSTPKSIPAKSMIKKPASLGVRVKRKLRREAGKILRQITDQPAKSIGHAQKATKPQTGAPVLTAAQKSIQTAMIAAKAGNREKAETVLADIQSRTLLNAYQQNAATGIQSFLDYSDKPAGEKLRLVWWEKPYPGNFGDWLSPLIFYRATQDRKVMFVPPNGKAKGPHIVGLGSIMRFVNVNSIVTGAGISQLDLEINPKAQYVSVRGPLTAKAIQEAGGPSVTSFGDPGILMRRFMPVARSVTNGRTALVRHYAHRKLFIKLPDYMDEHSNLMSDAHSIHLLMQTLSQYDSVVTSAMHIYIVCQSYGIPCALVTFTSGEGMVAGDGTKYIDYARGVGVPEAAPTVVDLDLRTRDFDNLITDHVISQAKTDEVEEALKSAISAYDAKAG